MTLHIAENIRRLRLEHSLTQGQLAERLGVSYQAVSRWENGTTYPDIELLPSIASLFGVTVDWLLGSTVADPRLALKQSWDKLGEIADPRERVSLLRQMHRDFPDDWYLFARLCAEVTDLPEKRTLTEKLVSESPVPYARAMAIRQIIRDETEELVLERMYQYNLPEACWEEFLEDRYRARGEVSKYRRKRQAVLMDCFRKAMERMTDSSTDILPVDPLRNEAGARAILSMIAALTDTSLTRERPVAGDGGPDLWVHQRVWAGISIACSLSAKGEGEEALRVLEDAAALVEELRRLPDNAPLSYKTPGLDSFDTTRERQGGIRYRADDMAEQFSHTAFDLLRRDPAYAPRFEGVRQVFVEDAYEG